MSKIYHSIGAIRFQACILGKMKPTVLSSLLLVDFYLFLLQEVKGQLERLPKSLNYVSCLSIIPFTSYFDEILDVEKS